MIFGLRVRPLNLTSKCKGYEKIILVSDALAPCGAPVGEYILGENTPVIADGTAAYLKDKSALAGSTTNIAKVKEIIAQTGATSMKDMGKVMGIASKQMAGQADGGAISKIVRSILA